MIDTHSSPSRRLILAATAALLCLLNAGCFAVPQKLQATSRYDYGIIYILPGIEGRSMFNYDVAVGLGEGGVNSAVEIYDWTVGVPGSFVWNLADIDRNREQARELALRIAKYREEHPNRPVHIVGHSGGAGIAVLALEQLPKRIRVDMALLLAPALSPNYDLSRALRQSRVGICNFYSEDDVTLLKFGTSVFGSIDREFSESAGAVGFRQPATLDDISKEFYATRLYQVKWTPALAQRGASGSHLGWTSREFARTYLSPLITRNEAAHPMNVAAPPPGRSHIATESSRRSEPEPAASDTDKP